MSDQQAIPAESGFSGRSQYICLGAKLRKIMLENGGEALSMSLSKYMQEAVKNVKNYFQEKESGRPWLKKAPTPFAKDYRLEINILPKQCSYYMS